MFIVAKFRLPLFFETYAQVSGSSSFGTDDEQHLMKNGVVLANDMNMIIIYQKDFEFLKNGDTFEKVFE